VYFTVIQRIVFVKGTLDALTGGRVVEEGAWQAGRTGGVGEGGRRRQESRRCIIVSIEKVRITAEINAFKNTDFSDSPELTDEQLKQLKPYQNMANYNP
jgi:uncharacterized SAM-binding protein YcdF (DUF218 family)